MEGGGPTDELGHHRHGPREDAPLEPGTSRVDGSHDLPGVVREEHGQAIGDHDGRARRVGPAARVDHHTVGRDVPLLPRGGVPVAGPSVGPPQHDDLRGVGLPHPHQGPTEVVGEGGPACAHEVRVVTDVQAQVLPQGVLPRPGAGEQHPGPAQTEHVRSAQEVGDVQVVPALLVLVEDPGHLE